MLSCATLSDVELSVSVPKKLTLGSRIYSPKYHPVDDTALVQISLALRLLFPLRRGITSSRESKYVIIW